jgi:hypothetical protein
VTSTRQLTAFLLARIKEDQDAASTVHDGSSCDLATRGAVDPVFGWTCTCAWPDRVLADCGARRRLISRLESLQRAPYGAGFHAREALRDLASVYMNHPDYLVEWRQA